MIIKSLSRKNPSFAQLYDYLNREGKTEGEAITWNLATGDPENRPGILDEFFRNSRHLAKRVNGNVLYHEVVSLKRLPEDSIDDLRSALVDLTVHYLENRAPEQLGFGRVHIEDEHVHCHLMISANAIADGRRCLSRREFAAIQRDCERFLSNHYPNLSNPCLYTKARDTPNPRPIAPEALNRIRSLTTAESFQAEIREIIADIGPSRHEERAKAVLGAILDQEITHLTLPISERFAAAGYEIYLRGTKSHGVICRDGGNRKYRLRRLGLIDPFLRVQSEEAAFAARREELAAHTIRTGPSREAMELVEDFAPDSPIFPNGS